MQKLLSLSAALLLAISAAYPSAALADKGGNGPGKHGSKHHGKGNKHADDDHDEHGAVIRIDKSDRVVIREYIAEDYRSHCPPGLAKKHNGCLPPGQAKKRYSIGRPLPDGIIFEPVPSVLLGRLRPVPAGYQYVTVDRDVLLISEASHKVIDAITLMSAVGK